MTILSEIQSAEIELMEQARILKGFVPVIDFYEEEIENSITENYRVLKTATRSIHSIKYGSFLIRKTYFYNLLNHSSKETTSTTKKQFSSELNTLVAGKKQFSFDVMCLIGSLRFIQDYSREETQTILKSSHNLSISTGSISNYSIEFLVRFYLYHQKHFHLLVQAIAQEGGYVLGADGSGQKDSKRILILMDLLKGWTLKAQAISTEASDLIIPLFEELIELAGPPLAYVRDMGKGLRKAGECVFPNIPTRECNFHFLRDVGKDLMLTEYQDFKKVLVTCKIKSKLESFRKSLKGQAEEQGINLKVIIQSLKLKIPLNWISFEHILLAEMYHLLSWILNYSEDAHSLRFPYSLPWIFFYHRFRSAQEIYTEIKHSTDKSIPKPPYFNQFESLLMILFSDNTASKLVPLEKSLMKSFKYFSELRKILKLSEIKGDIPREQLLLSDSEISNVEAKLITFKADLLLNSKNNLNPNLNIENILLKHLDHHWKYLIVPNLELSIDGKKKTLAIPRAISLADSRFGKIKTSIRKRTGRTIINYDLDRYGVFLCYLENLHSAEYVKLLFGTKENIPLSLSTIPSYEVQKFITDFTASQEGYDITRARGNNEYEDFLEIASSVNTIQNLSLSTN